MAEGYELAKAYVQIIPTTKNMKSNLSNLLGSDMEAAGTDAGNRAGTNAGNGILGSLKGVITVAAVVAAVSAIGKGVASVIEKYADFEQLVGGVETLFKDSAGIVMDYANEAYKTSGLSANAYMETVTGFSASLLQSLGGDTKAAAALADQAIVDMADNANKMGSSMESIQTAYQGFAKQNYTMLDNLKLGYGGTKSEMERLVEDAEKLDKSFKAQRDENGDLTLSYSDIITAIHAVQTEMGITGTTQKEAAETISGSLYSMKASWENLITGLGNPEANVKELTSQLVENAKNFINNIKPVIMNLVEVLPELFNAIGELLPDLIPFILEFMKEIAKAIIKNFPEILLAIGQCLLEILDEVGTWIAELIGFVDEEGDGIWDNVAAWFVELGQSIWEWLLGIIDSVGQFFTNLWNSITGWLSTTWSNIIGWLSNLWNSISNFFSTAWQFGKQLVMGIWNGISSWASTLWSNISGWCSSVWNAFTNGLSNIWEIGKNIVEGIWNGISGAASWLWEQITGWVGGIVDGIKGLLGIKSPSRVFRDEVGYFIAAGLADGIDNGADLAVTAVENLGDDLIDTMDNMIGEFDDMTFDVFADVNGRMLQSDLDALNLNYRGSNSKASALSNAVNYIQNIYSPRALNESDIYRQSKNLITLGAY